MSVDCQGNNSFNKSRDTRKSRNYDRRGRSGNIRRPRRRGGSYLQNNRVDWDQFLHRDRPERGSDRHYNSSAEPTDSYNRKEHWSEGRRSEDNPSSRSNRHYSSTAEPTESYNREEHWSEGRRSENNRSSQVGCTDRNGRFQWTRNDHQTSIGEFPDRHNYEEHDSEKRQSENNHRNDYTEKVSRSTRKRRNRKLNKLQAAATTIPASTSADYCGNPIKKDFNPLGSSERIGYEENISVPIPSECSKDVEIKVGTPADVNNLEAGNQQVVSSESVAGSKPKVIRKSSSSSSSDSDSSESADSDIKDLRKCVNESLFKKKAETSKAEAPKAETPKAEAPKTEILTASTINKKISSESSSDSSSSDSDSLVSTKKLKKEKNSEDEVVCLGKLENFENLVEDEDSSTATDESCLLCDKKGHTSFCCFMVCKNCGEKYHGLKDCRKPPNVSTVLQSFMEFCLGQLYQYNPERKFSFNQDIPAEFAQNLPDIFNVDSLKHVNMKHKSTISSLAPSRPPQKRTLTSNTDSSSDENVSKRKKLFKHKNAKTETMASNSFPQLPFNSPFAPVLPFPYNPQGLQFNPQGVQINPLLSYAQMMGLNPLNFSNSVNKFT